MKSVLYITRNGLCEPLGQSQVMGYLHGLSFDFHVTLITYEKASDLADYGQMDRVQKDCEAHGILWLPQRFHHQPRFVAPALSMLGMLWFIWREVRRGNAQLIHARSYIPAAAALLAYRLTGVPFIFDMRALWPEELITAGRLRRDSLIHKVISRVERACLRNAAAVVSLTEAAVQYLEQQYSVELQGQRIEVIPTCADLERFRPAPERSRPPVYGCVGTVLSGWFRLDWLAVFFEVVAEREPEAQFEVVTRDDEAVVRNALDRGGALAHRLSVYSMPSDKVHEAVQRHKTSVMFFTEGLSKLGSSPTRMGETLGCGRPVVANEGVGDVARIIREYRVGVIVGDASRESMSAAYDELQALLKDPELPTRCRTAAEEVFSLSAGVEKYRALYENVLAGESISASPGKHQ